MKSCKSESSCNFLFYEGFIILNMKFFVLWSLLVFSLQAQEVPEGKSALTPEYRQHLARTLLVRQLILNKYDHDKDGQLNDEERAAFKLDAQKARCQAAERFKKRCDINKDGKISPEERAEAQQRPHRRCLQKGQAMPHDSAPDVGAPLMPPPPPDVDQKAPEPEKVKNRHPRMTPLFLMTHKLLLEQFDANKNGRIDLEEHQKLQAQADVLFDRCRVKLLLKYDLNNDHSLSADEIRKAKESMAASESSSSEIDDEELNELLDADSDVSLLEFFDLMDD